MKNIMKSCEEDADDASSLSRLPDEIILQIFNKLIDLKILCFCYLVSKRFSSIVLQVDVVSFTPTLLKTHRNVEGVGFPKKLLRLLIKPLHLLRGMIVAPSRQLPPVISSFYSESFRSAYTFLSKFTGMKSLCIELTFSSVGAIDNQFLFTLKVKFGKGIESFIFLSPNSIYDSDGFHLNGNGDGEEDMGLTNDLFKQKSNIAVQCFRDVILWHRMLLYIVMCLPKLEEVSITDSGRRGRFSLNGETLDDVKEWLHSASETVNSEIKHIKVPGSVSQCYIPALNLPVSGYVMKGITVIVMDTNDLQGGNDVLMISNDGIEDKEEAAYSEAMEILEKHNGRM